MVFFWQGWIFIVVYGLSLVVANGSYSLVLVHELLIVAASLIAEHGLYFSSCGTQAREHEGFNSCSSWALEPRLGSCDTWA